MSYHGYFGLDGRMELAAAVAAALSVCASVVPFVSWSLGRSLDLSSTTPYLERPSGIWYLPTMLARAGRSLPPIIGGSQWNGE